MTTTETLSVTEFGQFFCELWGFEPYDWQRRLAEQVIQSATGEWPEVISLPTAAGKTACLDIAVFAMAAMASDDESGVSKHPRRLFYAVDRRNIVDQTYKRASDLSEKLKNPKDKHVVVCKVAQNLRALAGNCNPLVVYRMRGGIRQAGGWERNPRQPAIITTTVDQVGSSMLFSAYGKGTRSRPVYAGLATNDSVIILDEAHCAQPFLQTLRAVKKYRSATQPLAPFQAVVMSATAPEDEIAGPVFKDTSEQPKDPKHQLGKRQLASKPATLLAVNNAKGKRAPVVMGQALADHAMKMLDEETKTIVVFSNRVATARAAYQRIRGKLKDKTECVLITGRMRQLERDEAVKKLKAVSPDEQRKTECVPSPEPTAERQLPFDQTENPPQATNDRMPLIAVATQTLEIGADLDFDGLVTECASLDALQQRLGRLNRTGREIKSPATILIRADQIEPKTPDPIYGDGLTKTWQWLNAQKGDAATIDLGIASVNRLLKNLSGSTDRADLNAPSKYATVMLPAHIDAWAETSGDTWPLPKPETYLHGIDASPPDVQICWRAGLDLNNPELVRDILQTCPPNSLETLPVPLHLFREWCNGLVKKNLDDDTGDATEENPAERATNADIPKGDWRVIRWRGNRDKNDVKARDVGVSSSRDVRGGDTVIIPTAHPGDFSAIGDLPEDYEERGNASLDIGDATNRTARGRPSLRFTAEMLDNWEKKLTQDIPEGECTPQYVRDALKEINDPDLTPRERDDCIKDRLLAPLASLTLHERSPLRYLKDNACGLLKVEFKCLSISENHALLQAKGALPIISAGTTEQHDDESDALHSQRTRPIQLERHLRGVEQRAREYAEAAGIPDTELEAICSAALLHDIGKADPLFQKAMHGGKRGGEELLAKSPNFIPSGIRHELMSAQMAVNSRHLLTQDPESAELALHLIASHHGYCRPFAPYSKRDQVDRNAAFVIDDETLRGSGPTKLVDAGSGVAERYWRLTRKYGWWGLAYMEALLRVADWTTSEDEQRGE